MKLDLCCGQYKHDGYVGMDKRNIEGVDYVHDVQKFPYPLKDNSCSKIRMHLAWACIEPKYRVDLMNELHRIMKPNGVLEIREVHNLAPAFIHDPIYYTGANETTFWYFDPSSDKYKVYEPCAWKIIMYASDYRSVVEVRMEAVK